MKVEVQGSLEDVLVGKEKERKAIFFAAARNTNQSFRKWWRE